MITVLPGPMRAGRRRGNAALAPGATSLRAA